MKNYKFNLNLFIIIVANVSLLLTATSLYAFRRLNWETFRDLLLHNGLVLLPLTLLYYYFENFGWRQNMWKWTRHYLRFPPDLRGRWEGTFHRNYPKPYTSGFVIEIEQTMTKLQVYTYSEKNSESESILDEIACDIQHESNFKLCYLWEGKASNLPDQEATSGKFMGYTILRLKETKEKREFNGEYFTDRKPEETQGQIKTKWTGFELKKQF